MIKSNDGMIHGKLTYARVTIRHKNPETRENKITDAGK